VTLSNILILASIVLNVHTQTVATTDEVIAAPQQSPWGVVLCDNSASQVPVANSGTVVVADAIYRLPNVQFPPLPHPLTQSNETTVIIEEKLLVFEWEGQKWTGKTERELSKTVRTWKLKVTNDWIEQVDTNKP